MKRLLCSAVLLVFSVCVFADDPNPGPAADTGKPGAEAVAPRRKGPDDTGKPGAEAVAPRRKGPRDPGRPRANGDRPGIRPENPRTRPVAEVPQELKKKYDAMTDEQLVAALNEVSGKSIEASRALQESRSELENAWRNSDASEEIAELHAKRESLVRELRETELALKEAVKKLPEMQSKNEEVAKAERAAAALSAERNYIRQVRGERMRANRKAMQEKIPSAESAAPREGDAAPAEK